MKNKLQRWGTLFILNISAIILFLSVFPSLLIAADSGVCARVKIEILQEASFERQAFEAHMKITNGVGLVSLDNVSITVKFTDKDGNPVLATSDTNNTNALFFIQPPTMQGITNITGSGIVQPSSTADINWLIIPAPGASNGLPAGTMYYVGATLSYSVGGEQQTVDVSPDYIYVKPMPEIVLDYFLPTDVYGDDAFTPEIEPPIPFSLGVRVRNSGAGTATNFKINSAQPKIVENNQGLLIGFNIEAAEVNGKAAEKTLLINFGDIKPNTSAAGRWIMTCTLSGKFKEFTADYSHSDALGGELTSLLTAVNTHFLIRDVLVDLPGRDGIRDFLAQDSNKIRIYESDNTETDVLDQSASSALTGAGSAYILTTPVTSGFMYVKLPDPFFGQQAILDVLRSDGKHIKPENVWLSKTRGTDNAWVYSLSIFDANTPGKYTINFGAVQQSQNPVLMFIPDKTVVEGNTLSFIVQASSPDGKTPLLSVSGLPAKATFTDQSNGTGIFSWPTSIGQFGKYNLTFKAANPANTALTNTQNVKIKVNSIDDTNGNGIPDWWELKYFGNLDRDGTGSFANDGISDLQKYLLGLDPTRKYTDKMLNAPTAPVIQSPAVGAEANNLQPTLAISNSSDPGGGTLQYVFEVYADKEMTNMITSMQNLAQGDQTTSWQIPAALIDHTRYYWRVRAQASKVSSSWTYGNFFVNLANEAPGAFRISAPADNIMVDSITPVLSVNNSKDPDEDVVSYKFRVYSDSSMSTLIASADNIVAGGNGTTSWPVNVKLLSNTKYYWKAIAVDEHGAQTGSALVSFTVNTSSPAPKPLTIQAPASGGKINTRDINLVAVTSTNANAASLTYYFEVDKVNTFDSPALKTSGAINGSADTVTWHLSSLADNTQYFWRVKANNGQTESSFVTGSFFINVDNIVPLTPTVKNPGDNSWVSTLTPLLAAVPVASADNDAITYRFEVYADISLKTLLFQKETINPQCKVSALTDKQWFYWRVQVVDEHGAASPWTSLKVFYVRDNSVNDPPQITLSEPPSDVYLKNGNVIIKWDAFDEDSNPDITLYYGSTASSDGTQIATGFKGDDNGGKGSYTWDIGSQAEGTYYIYALITDGAATVKSYAPGKIIIDRTAPQLTAAPVAGTYAQAQNVTLTANEEAVIYYTLDGTDPSTASTVYSTPIAVNQSATIKAIAVDKAGNPSAMMSIAYTIQHEIFVRLQTNTGRKLAGIIVYAFTGSGSYINKNATTDADGIAHFQPQDFTAGAYKYRVDYLGYRYWSEVINIPAILDLTMVIAESDVIVKVETAAGPAAGVKIYLFNETGSYLGIYGVTDASGNVTFSLPVGGRYKMRADILGSQYWSDVVAVAGGVANNISVNAGGGALQVNILKAAGTPLTGVTAYLFNTAGTYMGVSQVSDATGKVAFNVPRGTYKVRVDYLGYQFWTPDNVVTAGVTTDFIIAHQNVEITVSGVYQGVFSAISNVNVYLFNSAGSYLGISPKTDASGKVIFNVPQKAYKVRVDYLGQQFWSGEFTWLNTAVNIPMADAVVNVSGSGMPHEGVSVYVFTTANSYLGLTAKTDTQGRVTFRLPAGAYKFRADYQSYQFWSDNQTLIADQSKAITISTGGGNFSLTVNGNSNPLTGLKCYVYNDKKVYLGIVGSTDASGKVVFALASGSYTFRVDYLGYQFWSDVVNVPATLDLTMVIPMSNVSVHVGTAYGFMSGIKVYLYSESGSYLGIYALTDAAGNVIFSLPVGGRYKLRYDIMGSQYWSNVIVVANSANNVSLNAGGGVLQVNIWKATGVPLVGVTAYLFNQNGSYLGVNQSADSSGRVAFNVSKGTYKVRVDYLGYQFWTPDNIVNANITTDLMIAHKNVTVSAGGLYQGVSSPLAGINVYLFNSLGSYVGQTFKTDNSGNVVFSVPEKAYKARVDYLDQQYWTGEFTWLNTAVNIPMANAVITMNGIGMPRADIPVYIFTSGKSYLGLTAKTATDGTVTFRMPAGIYKFRADYQTNQFWTDDQTIVANQANNVSLSDGGGNFTLTVKANADSLSGVKCYVYSSSGSYIGLTGVTNGNGQYAFELSTGSYKFRIDYMGYQFWTDVYPVPSQLSGEYVINLQNVAITLNTYYNSYESLTGVNAYLFTQAGSYINLKQVADSNGIVNFAVPEKPYKVRVDYLGRQFWTDVFQWQNKTLTINQGLARVNVQKAGTSINGAAVYLFSDTGSYLGQHLSSDVNGNAEFKLPAYPFKFRVDVAGKQYWSSVVTVVEGVDTNVYVTLD